MNGSFRIDSSTMSFSGSGRTVVVAIDAINRQQNSGGFTRFELRGMQASGRSMLIQGPGLPLFRGQSYRVVGVTFLNWRAESYASPGVLQFR